MGLEKCISTHLHPKTSEFNAPLTSFDWSCKQQNYIGTASIDTTCTLWEIEK